MTRNFALAAGLVALGASTALANDTTAVLKTGGLEFTRSTDISMEKEVLFISMKEIRVDYVFRNSSDKAIDTLVAFPMPDIEGGPMSDVSSGDQNQDNFLDFTVTQDGEAIEPELQQRAWANALDVTEEIKAAGVSLLPNSDDTIKAVENLPQETRDKWVADGLLRIDSWDQGNGEETHYMPIWTLKSAYYWRAHYEPGVDIKVSHTYKPSVGGTVQPAFLDENREPKGQYYEEYKAKYCIDDAFVRAAQKTLKALDEGKPYHYESWISYVLTTGANWAGPIKDFTLIVDKGSKDNYVSFCGTGVKKIGPTTFEMKAKDFWPEKDLDILILNYNVQAGNPG